MKLTGKQCAAGRTLLGEKQEVFAKAAGVAVRTLIDFENGNRDAKPETKEKITRALEAAGIALLENQGVAFAHRVAA